MLHVGLPPDSLESHRLRFLKQFNALRQFYLQSSTLQYFKTLIQVPYLDEVSHVIIGQPLEHQVEMLTSYIYYVEPTKLLGFQRAESSRDTCGHSSTRTSCP